MWFMNYIISRLESIGEFFFDAYVEVNDWWVPFRYLAPPLYHLYLGFYWLANHFYQFNEWLVWAADEIGKIISSFDVMELIAPFIQWGIAAWEWVEDAFHNVLTVINDWWLRTYPVIQGWIDIATQGLTEIKVTWDNFRTVTLPTLVSWPEFQSWWLSVLSEIQDLIDSAFTFREGFWQGWQEIRDKVNEFFTDPLQWFYDRLDEFFERFW